ncbi:hypothetical protein D3C80_1171960 [compost metagenome]
MAGRCRPWLVEPPLASSAATALTSTRASTWRPSGSQRSPWRLLRATSRAASAVSSGRSADSGGAKALPGTCRPMASISSWLVLAVP